MYHLIITSIDIHFSYFHDFIYLEYNANLFVDKVDPYRPSAYHWITKR